MPTENEFFEINSWNIVGSASQLHDCTILYRGLISSVLEYGSVCFSTMANCHMLKLERMQYRAIRIALGLMTSTPNNSLGVLSGITPLQTRIRYLNFRYFVAAFGKIGHPLKEKLRILESLNSRRTFTSFEAVNQLNIVETESFTKYNFKALLIEPEIDKSVEQALVNVDASMYHIMATAEIASITANYPTCNVFYTDGSLIDGKAGFFVHNSIDCNIGFQLEGPCSVFTTELYAISTALSHMIQNEPPGQFLILTDSLSSLKAMESKKLSHHTNPMESLLFFE
jgi:hypothetical protein